VTVLLFEEFHTFRQIFLDGRPELKAPEPGWFGYSVGRWDRDALIVTTTGLNEKTWLDDAGHPHSDALKVIERFERPDFGHMLVRVTIDVPKAYRSAWTVVIPWDFMPDSDLLDWVCENERDLAHSVGK